jgi:hypothetical protein
MVDALNLHVKGHASPESLLVDLSYASVDTYKADVTLEQLRTFVERIRNVSRKKLLL